MNRLIVISCLFSFAISEKFSAISEMEKLARDEELILKEFRTFIAEVQNEITYLNRKLSDWTDENERVRSDVIKYITNPINALLMIKRSTADIDSFQERLVSTFTRFRARTEEMRPTSEDLSGAVAGLLRLQRIYTLRTSDIVNGVIQGEKVSEKMKPHDLYTIAAEATQLENESFFVIEYLHELQKSLKENADEFGEVDEQHVSRLTLMTQNATGDNPYEQSYVKTGVYSIPKEQILYSQLCRKEQVKTPKEMAALRCRLFSPSPFSTIAPYKVEEADLHSNLVIFHDIVSESEIKVLTKIARSKLSRGKIIAADSQSTKSTVRVAKIAWIKDHESETVARISRRIEDMTGLTMVNSEELQVQNYGIGGHYNPHYDIRIKREGPYNWKGGNRIATVLFYLSTVERGGATVFPFLKVHVPAVRGTAAFWYNLRDTGDDDYYTRHAACPVLIGSKWVANKWIHEHDQAFRRPCVPGEYVETSEQRTMRDFF